MPDQGDDLRQVGASPASKALLEQLQRQGHVDDLMDGYRLAIAAAIAFGRTPKAQRGPGRTTMFAAGNLDPEQALRMVVAEIYPEAKSWPYRAAEDLAEQGIEILREAFEGEQVWFGDLLERIESSNAPSPPVGAPAS